MINIENKTQNEMDELITTFQSCCKFHFTNRFNEHKFLFFYALPFDNLGTKYDVELVSAKFSWKETPTIVREIHKGIDPKEGEEKYKFEQKCSVDYSFKIGSIICSPVKNKELTFVAFTFSPFGLTFFPSFHESQSQVLDSLSENKIEIKKQLNLLHIDEQEYDDSIIGVAFYANVIRKQRINNQRNKGLFHLNYYYEIANCHWQIEDCLLKAVYYFKYTTDFLSRRIDEEDSSFFIPAMNNYDNQYLLYLGFGFERIYSFWDRMTILLYGFDDLKLNQKKCSFFNYMEAFKKINKCKLNKNSQHSLWLLEFYEKLFKPMIEYRHRIVHFQFTHDWAGILTAKFSSNTQGNIMNEGGLQELKIEFEALLTLLYDNYLHCKDGVINVLKLIDEIE